MNRRQFLKGSAKVAAVGAVAALVPIDRVTISAEEAGKLSMEILELDCIEEHCDILPDGTHVYRYTFRGHDLTNYGNVVQPWMLA